MHKTKHLPFLTPQAKLFIVGFWLEDFMFWIKELLSEGQLPREIIS